MATSIDKKDIVMLPKIDKIMLNTEGVINGWVLIKAKLLGDEINISGVEIEYISSILSSEEVNKRGKMLVSYIGDKKVIPFKVSKEGYLGGLLKEEELYRNQDYISNIKHQSYIHKGEEGSIVYIENDGQVYNYYEINREEDEDEIILAYNIGIKIDKGRDEVTVDKVFESVLIEGEQGEGFIIIRDELKDIYGEISRNVYERLMGSKDLSKAVITEVEALARLVDGETK